MANRGDLIRAMQAQGHVVIAAVPAEDMLDSVYDLCIQSYTHTNMVDIIGTTNILNHTHGFAYYCILVTSRNYMVNIQK